MNRRDFFKFASVAPIAAPAVLKSAASARGLNVLSEGIMSIGFNGAAVDHISMKMEWDAAPVQELLARIKSEAEAMHGLRSLRSRRSVQEQMRDHDLFEDSDLRDAA